MDYAPTSEWIPCCLGILIGPIILGLYAWIGIYRMWRSDKLLRKLHEPSTYQPTKLRVWVFLVTGVGLYSIIILLFAAYVWIPIFLDYFVF